MKTSASYIHEYSLFDAVLESVAEGKKTVYEAVVSYETAAHKLDMMNFFEDANADVKSDTSEKRKNIFERIGAQVMKIVNAVTKFIADLSDNLLKALKISKTDEEKVNQILKSHPELRNEVVNGIDKNWFSVKDVAQYEKDVIGLCEMLKQNKIDHQTFMEKLSASAKKFNESAKPIVDAAGTVGGILGAIGLLHKKANESKSALDSLKKRFAEFGKEVDNNKAYAGEGTASAIFNAFSDLIHARTQDCKDHASMVSKTNGILGKIINSGVGKALKVDDASRTNRYVDKEVGKNLDKQVRNEKNKKVQDYIDSRS